MSDRRLYEPWHDQAGNRTRWWKRGQSSAPADAIVSTFDALNRETVRDLPGGGADDVYTAYDLTDRVLSVRYASAGGAGIGAAYDQAGRMVGETTYGRSLAYGYDAAGNRNRVTWPDGFFVAYDHDPANQLIGVRENGATTGAGVLAGLVYDDLGRRTGLYRGNGTVAAYGYDAASRPAVLAQDLASTGFDVGWTFAWSPASQLVARVETNAVYGWTPVGGTTATIHDGLNRDTGLGTTRAAI